MHFCPLPTSAARPAHLFFLNLATKIFGDKQKSCNSLLCSFIRFASPHIDYKNSLHRLTLILLMWRIGSAPHIASRWQMGFNSAFKGLNYM
jgi:hypothetical protein